jgi:hypothetical protein
MSSHSDYLENKIVDWFRGQAFPGPPASLFVGLYTTATDDAAGGTEVTGGSYARASVAASLANFAGTQGAGTTTVSTGTTGITSNNVAIVFPAPTANWGTVTHYAVFDAAAGNRLFAGPLTTALIINSGQTAPTFPVGSLTLTEA